MEWALDRPTPESVAALRREVMAYLRRHAEPDSDLAGAEVVVAELLLNAFQHAPVPAWVRTSWTGERKEPFLRALTGGARGGGRSTARHGCGGGGDRAGRR